MRQFLDGFGQLLPSLLDGAQVTAIYSITTIVLAVLLGLMVTCMRLYLPRPAGWIAGAYVEIFRNTPLLLQLYAIYYGLSQLSFVTAPVAGVAALTLNYGAYEAENIRAGLQAIDRGQWEAAQALGLRTPRTLWRIVLPQAIRTIIPPVANDFIYLFKDSSILSLITITELTAVAHHAADRTFDNTPYIYAAIIYLCMSYPTSLVARWLERSEPRRARCPMNALWNTWQLYSPFLLQGAWLTLRLSLAAMLLALALGIVGAIGRLSPAIPSIRVLATVYVETFRGTPILIQLYVANFVVVGWLNDQNINPDTFLVGAATLGLNYGAYLTEVYRAGILTVDRGQREAAQSLGMRDSRIFRRVVLPQAFRIVIPPLANNFITLIQDSSYLSAISLVELTNASEALAAGNGVDTRWQIYGIAGVFYFLLCYPIALLARYAERRLRLQLS